MSTTTKEYICMNGPKFQAAIVDANKMLRDGLVKEVTDELILSMYDRRGGLVKDSSGNPIKTGFFFDFENKKPIIRQRDVKARVSKKEETTKKVASKK